MMLSILIEINVTKTSTFHSKSATHLTDCDKLVKWTLHSKIVSNSLSGATQLLVIAHTPVSRKVFQYFHCNDLAGTFLLRADYHIDCKSDEYYAFMPAVLFLSLIHISEPTRPY